MDAPDKFLKLRQENPELIYDSFSVISEGSDLKVKYKFIQSEKIVFEPFIIFRDCTLQNIKNNYINAALFNIGMIEMASYYKACCSPKIVIRAGNLTSEQKEFWKKIIYRGLGEFLYTNNINTSEDSLFYLENGNGITFRPFEKALPDEVLIPVGGGKDSVVTLELLNGMKCVPLIMNPRGASVESARTAGYDNYIRIERSLDPLLLELNARGYLNGHTPFSALLAFVSAAASILYYKKYIALSNENSANEGNAFFSGIEINHQYSKSFEAERSLHEYIKKFISEDTYYFSFLRPLNELKIAELFSRHKKHFSTFRSCNAGSKENKWCLKCSKCLFTYIILSPFLEDIDLTGIFGKNMFEDKELEQVFFELCGLNGIKPFECVGTISEVNAALKKKISLYKNTSLPYLLEQYNKRTRTENTGSENSFENILQGYSTDNLLPDGFRKVLTENL